MKTKTMFVCEECGYTVSKWLGKCPACGEWNTLIEKQIVEETPSSSAKRSYSAASADSAAVKIGELELPSYMRISTGCDELDRVLGGGIVPGSVILLAGEPGIGKSTLLLQISETLESDAKVLYASGEESKWQLKYRAKRLGVNADELYVLTETNIDRVIAQYNEIKPDYVIIDSVQTMYDESISSAPGSVTQVRETAMKLMNLAKNNSTSVILVGHVNKEGGIAGPKVLEHMVDAVLYFEGERQHAFRIIRAAKNRYGSTNEIGVFEMGEEGLREVDNPSEMLLSGRPSGISGNCAVCIMEGSRPIIAEVQALCAKTVFSSPKRTSNGIDYNRLYMILAVLERRLGLRFSENDIYMNVVGGLHMDDPSSDLACALSLISAIRDVPLDDKLIAFGELGLAGECRPVSFADMRIREAVRLGFTKIILPYGNKLSDKDKVEGVEIVRVRSIFEALKEI